MSPLVVICDLDNTLYNWVDSYIPAMREMIHFAADILECDPQLIVDDLRDIHKLHGTIERPFSLLETGIVRERLRGRSRKEQYDVLDMAFYAFNWTRKEKLKLYPGVREVIEHINRHSMRLVGFTDANAFGVVDRLRRLDVADSFFAVFCAERPATLPPDHGWSPSFFDEFPDGVLIELSAHQRKPDPAVLAEVLERAGGEASRCIYAGDSLHRDMMMAHNAGVPAAWAKYGTDVEEENLRLLAMLSHWSAEELALDRRLRREVSAMGLQPDYTMHASFSEVLCCLS